MFRCSGFRAPFSVVAVFSEDGDASVAVDALATRGVPLPAITTHRPDGGTPGDEAAERSQARRPFLSRRRGDEPGTDSEPRDQNVLVALHLCDPEQVERTAALLRGLGAERVDLFDARGTPISVSGRRET